MWFDRVFCISHPMTMRWKEMESRLLNCGVVPERVYARRPSKLFSVSNMRRNPQGEFGCNLSHVKALTHAIGCDNPLFLEDDVVFSEDTGTVLTSAFSDLPDDWAVLYLGGHPCEDVERVGENLVRVGRFSFAESYAVRGQYISKLLDYWFDRIGQPNAMFDIVLGEFARDTNSYAVYPPVTRQPDGHSFVAERADSKTRCVTSGWQNHLQD